MSVIKTKRTYYTDDKINAAAKNIAKYDWAREKQDKTVELAERFLAQGYNKLWDIVTSQKLPRSLGVNQTLGCPVCGKGIDKFGNYPYESDPINKPWKITCPNCKTVFPSNDFEAYYKSGLDDKGFFDPDAADRKFLKNELYPDKGEGWCVDDGYGWIDPANNDRETKRYTFIAYYNHWFIWNGYLNSDFSITGALSAFSNAYLFSGDKRFAAACAILLDRVADVYPTLDSSIFKHEDGFRNSHGGSGLGKAIGCIWETILIKQIIEAYDAVYDEIGQLEAIEFLKGKVAQYPGLTSKSTESDIKENFEQGVLRQVYPAVISEQIRGNVGMHQSALILAAVVLQDNEILQKSLEYIFKAAIRGRRGSKVNIMHILIDEVDRDGHGNEASPGYNSIWMNCIKLVADVLKGFDGNVPDLYNNVKFRKLFHMVHPLIVLDSYTPSIGDTKFAGNPGVICDLQALATSFAHTGDIKVAQTIYSVNGNKVEGICKDIFADCEKIENQVLDVIKTHGTLDNESSNITGYGFAALRSGFSEDKRALTLYYGRNTGHGHKDTLNLGVYAFGTDLTPEHGYPCFADANLERRVWTINTVSHNTVMVDRQSQNNNVVGTPHHFDGSTETKLIDVEAPAVYPETSMYRRSAVLMKADERNSYVVDFFRVDGGNEHLYSFHGGEGDIVCEGLKLEAQGERTYAGKDIKFADAAYSKDKPDGFNYLYNVSRDQEPAAKFSVDWAVKDTWKIHKNPVDMHIKLTMISKCNDIAIADGQPPQNKPGNPGSFKYLLAHRKGSNLKSQFVSVIEPYIGKNLIKTIEPVEVKVAGKPIFSNHVSALKLVLECGRVDYIVNSLDTGTVFEVGNIIRFSGFLGVCSLINDKPVYAYLNDGTLIEYNDNKLIENDAGALKGTVVDFTRALAIKNEILIELGNTRTAENIELTGKYIYIKNDGVRNATYKIEGFTKRADGRYLLNIGDITLIRQLADTEDIAKGYIYDIEAGAEISIPLELKWGQILS